MNMTGKSISKVIESGSKQAISDIFEDIYNEYYKLLFFVSFSYVKNETISEDVVQKSFVEFFKRCFDVEWVSKVKSVKSYLCTCAKNASIDENKKSQFIPIDDDCPPKTNEEIKEEYNLKELLNKLNEDEISIVIDHIFFELTFKEIALKTNVPMNTIKSKYRRAISKIRNEAKNEEKKD